MSNLGKYPCPNAKGTAHWICFDVWCLCLDRCVKRRVSARYFSAAFLSLLSCQLEKQTACSLLFGSASRRAPDLPVGVLLPIMTASLHIIPYITRQGPLQFVFIWFQINKVLAFRILNLFRQIQMRNTTLKLVTFARKWRRHSSHLWTSIAYCYIYPYIEPDRRFPMISCNCLPVWPS